MAPPATILSRAAWSAGKDLALIDALIQQARMGRRADSGFKKEAWIAVTDAVNAEYEDNLTVGQIKTRAQALKTKYTTIKAMLSASGFGWCAERSVVLVHDTVWVDYLKQFPKAIDYCYRPVPYSEDLVELYEGTHATGEHALASDEIESSTNADAAENQPEIGGDESVPPRGTVRGRDAVGEQPAGDAAGTNEEEENAKKRRRESGGAQIADAITQVATEMHNRTSKMKAMTASQKAIKILQRSYADMLTTQEMVSAFDIMLDESKARIFVVMEEGALRDA